MVAGDRQKGVPAGDRATAKVANVVGGNGLEPLTSCVSSIATTSNYSEFLLNNVRTFPYMSISMYAELVKKLGTPQAGYVPP